MGPGWSSSHYDVLERQESSLPVAFGALAGGRDQSELPFNSAALVESLAQNFSNVTILPIYFLFTGSPAFPCSHR